MRIGIKGLDQNVDKFGVVLLLSLLNVRGICKRHKSSISKSNNDGVVVDAGEKLLLLDASDRPVAFHAEYAEIFDLRNLEAHGFEQFRIIVNRVHRIVRSDCVQRRC